MESQPKKISDFVADIKNPSTEELMKIFNEIQKVNNWTRIAITKNRCIGVFRLRRRMKFVSKKLPRSFVMVDELFSLSQFKNI